MSDRYQIIETATGHKLNVILWDGAADLGLGAGRRVEPDDGLPLWTSPAPMPDISDCQFAQGLWHAGIIAYADVIGFVGPGAIPGPLQAIVDTLPDDDTGAPTPRKLAIADLTGRKVYQFVNPLVEYVRTAMEEQDPKWTVDYLRQQWALWATL